MSVAAFCRCVRSRWYTLARLLWGEGPGQRTRAELARLDAELTRRHARLVRRRCRIEQLRDALRQQQRRIEQLTAEVGACVGQSTESAWNLDLALADLRDGAERLRSRLDHHEQAYERQRLRLEHCKGRRATLQREANGG
jgi:hypothetical protein